MADETVDAAQPTAEAREPQPEQQFGVPVTRVGGQAVLHVAAADYLDLVRRLYEDGHHMCVDLTAVDYLTYEADRGLPAGVPPERFEVVVGFLSHTSRSRVRVRVQVPESDTTLPSITDTYPGADAMEREVFDMFGITFTGHPDLTRILMPEDWVGNPLRKDYNSGRIPVQFKNPVSVPDAVAGQ